jgi:hypothetical protein
MPGSRRWTDLEWRHPTAPDRVVIRSAKFTLDTALAAVSVPPVPTPAPLPVLAADSGLAPAR